MKSSMGTKAVAIEMRDVRPIRGGREEAGRVWGLVPFCMCWIQGDLKASGGTLQQKIE